MALCERFGYPPLVVWTWLATLLWVVVTGSDPVSDWAAFMPRPATMSVAATPRATFEGLGTCMVLSPIADEANRTDRS